MPSPLIVSRQEGQPSVGGCHASGCQSPSDHLSHLPPSIRDKVRDHPCYSEEAHHHFARMHVAVAPACNIQCHYCNRKYDCANESRPGVVSELLTPDQAVKKVLTVAARIPQMTVLGIAGPGDPLANPERTFETFRKLSEKAPDIRLCVSTNGLALPDQVETLCRYNIDHVTITINCIDPEIGAQIYPWIFWNNRRIKGKKAAEILIERQQQGLEMLTERGILVKINSVMIPGVNDRHIEDVSQTVKAKGAFLHNVMPLIAEPEHGTFYGVMGQREPTHAELQSLQNTCAGSMSLMRHCRQCRADAVGMLGEDRGDEFSMDKVDEMVIDYAAAMRERTAYRQATLATLANQRKQTSVQCIPLVAVGGRKPKTSRPMLVAVATTGGDLINQHFGQAREFLVYEASPLGVRCVGHRKIKPHHEGNDDSRDAGNSAVQRAIAALADCEAVLCSKIGFEPWALLEQAGITPNSEHAMRPIKPAVLAVYAELVEKGCRKEGAVERIHLQASA